MRKDKERLATPISVNGWEVQFISQRDSISDTTLLKIHFTNLMSINKINQL